MNPTPPKALQALPVRQTSAWHADVSRQQMIVSKLALRRTLGSDLKRVDSHVVKPHESELTFGSFRTPVGSHHPRITENKNGPK